MTVIRIPYGHRSLEALIQGDFSVDTIETAETPAVMDGRATVSEALARPLGGFCWEDHAQAGSVAIAVNDKTRPVPHADLLPPLLERLASIGIREDAVTFFVAVGTHPAMRDEEFGEILPPEVLRRFRVISHDPADPGLCCSLGVTSRGTPVWIHRGFYEARFKIVVGNIEPHQFAGFSGGVKTAAIGLAGRQTISANHTRMFDAQAQLGSVASNPVRQDIEEIGRMVNIHLALNAVLNSQREIVQVLAGEPLEVMRSGVEAARRGCQSPVRQRYDLVISSPGGHPKDINLYQAQKALAHAAMITRPGGTIILAAACPEGTGSRAYEEWMRGRSSHEEVLECFRQEAFCLGPHKAYQIARDAVGVRLMFCSEMDPTLARALLLDPVADLQTAVSLALADLPAGSRIAVLPHATSTIPVLEE